MATRTNVQRAMSSKQFDCPSCGASVAFQCAMSVFAVCPYCRSMLVRHDLDVEVIGKMAVLAEDTSPFQLGTQGRYDGRMFQLIGRLKQQWSDGGWNEWCALFNDARHGWLAEAQGFYLVCFETEPAVALPARDTLRVEQGIQIGGESYRVDDIKEVTCAGSEGELPFPAPHGRKSTSVDLSADGGKFACIEYAEDGTRLSVGRYVDFAELKLSFLRKLDGW